MKVSSGFEYFFLIFALRLGSILKMVELDAELNSLSNYGIFKRDHRAKKRVPVMMLESPPHTFTLIRTPFLPDEPLENITIR
jgi:hypothetical protein